MSEEQLKAFLEAVKTDSALREKLQGVVEVDAVVAIAKEAGFSVLSESLRELQAQSLELSDEDLEGAAGGGIEDMISFANKYTAVPYKVMGDHTLGGEAGCKAGQEVANAADYLC
mgnify:CR=1 FL=1